MMRTYRDAGETLIETLISLIIIGIAVAAILGAVGSTSLLSADHRTVTTSDVDMKSIAEELKSALYVKNPMCVPVTPTCTKGYAKPAAPNGNQVSIESVLCWQPGLPTTSSYDTTGDFPKCNGSNDNGLQLLRVVVTSADLQITDATQVMKREP